MKTIYQKPNSELIEINTHRLLMDASPLNINNGKNASTDDNGYYNSLSRDNSSWDD